MYILLFKQDIWNGTLRKVINLTEIAWIIEPVLHILDVLNNKFQLIHSSAI